MANKEQFLDRNGVSHFYLLIKNKLTTFFKTLFVQKKDGYDLSQNDFTNELKTKLESISGDGSAEDEFIVITTTLNDETMECPFDEAAIETIQNYSGEKPMYLKLDGLGTSVYLPYISDGLFTIFSDGTYINVRVDIENQIGLLETSSTVINSRVKGANETYHGDDILNYYGLSVYVDKRLQDLGVYDDVVEGYFNAEDNLFYEEAEFETAITGENSKLYIGLNTNGSYRWTGSIFTKLESSSGLTALTNTEIDEIIASVDSSTE